MKTIKIFDTTLRDGEQSPGASLNKQEKIIIAKQLAKLGVDIIEAGFPIASDDDFEAVKAIAKEVNGPVICGLARCINGDIDRAWEAIQNAEKPRIHVFVATSQVHREEKFRKSKEEIIEMAVAGVYRAKSFCDDIEFSPEDAARTDVDYMCDVIEATINAGATTINIPDTVGYAQPEEFGARIKYVFDKLGDLIKEKDVTISVHCHNDLGLAVANSLAAVKNGATQIECTINGIGERAGNCSLEEAVMNINTRNKFFKDVKTNIVAKEICPTSKMVSSLTGLMVQRNKAIVGRNAFAHEAGIHQHGVIASKNTYEIMNPEDIGWVGENLVIGKHSGKHAVDKVLQELEYSLSKKQIEQITKKIKDLADKQKVITREDVIAVANDITNQLTEKEQIIKMEEIKITTGNKITPTAEVKIIVDGKEKVGISKGVGPVDALSNVVQEMIDPNVKLSEYNLKAITGGTDALADVSIVFSDKKGNLFRGQSTNEDIVMASANAIIQGANKALLFKKTKGEKK